MRACPQAWLREGQQWLRCPSASNQYWLRYAGIDLSAEYDPSAVSEELTGRICEAFGLFGTPEQCIARLPRARDEVGLRHAFLFPTRTWASHYDLPWAEVGAFGNVIGPALRDAGSHDSAHR